MVGESEILKYLNKHGYSLEMRTTRALLEARRESWLANSLQDFGSEVRQSLMYTDPATRKIRETDVVVDVGTREGLCRASAVIECKDSQEAPPWIGLRSVGPRRKTGAWLAGCPAQGWNDAGHVLTELSPVDSSAPLFQQADPHSGILTYYSGKPGKNRATDAVAQAASAAAGIVAEAGVAHLLPTTARAAVPVVVYNGPLWSARLDADGDDLDITEVKSLAVTWRADAERFTGVHVFDASDLPATATRIWETLLELREALDVQYDLSWPSAAG